MAVRYDVELYFGDTNPEIAIHRLCPPTWSGPPWSQWMAERLAEGFTPAWRTQTGVSVRVIEIHDD